MRNQEARIKRRSAVLAGLLVLVMLLTGTWAWQRFNQRAFNPYVRSHSEEDLGRNFGGRLHNDFKWYDNGTHNKDIYAENFGDDELFVRIQLREFLTIDGRIVGSDPGISINDPSTWPIYNSDKNDVRMREEGTDAALIGAADIEWEFGGDKIFMPTFNQATHEAIDWDPSVRAPFNHEVAYRMTNATGNAVDAIANQFNIGEVENVHDVIARGVQTGPGTTAGEPSVGDGRHDYWDEYETFDAPVLRVNENGHLYLIEDTHIAKSTITPTPVNEGDVNVTNGVMTLTQWQRAGKPNGDFWILDTENPGGWFYWASPLPAGYATSLLLDQLIINEQSADLEYIITPTADFVTRGYIDTLPGLSEDAREIWERASIRIDLSLNGNILPQGNAVSIERGTSKTLVPSLVLVSFDGVETTLQNGAFDWEIQESTSASTVANGVINIGAGETHDKLTLVVTEPSHSVSREVRIYVTNGSFTIPTTPGETFPDPETGTEWRVLVPADDPRGGIGNALIITEYVQMPNTPYHSDPGFTLFQSSDAQDNVRNWFNDSTMVGSTLRGIALDYEFQDADGNSIARTSTDAGDGIEVDRGNGTDNSELNAVLGNTNVFRGLTRPLAQGAGTPEPFILSTSEANEYFIDNADRQTQLATNTSRNAFWWLRSPGASTIDWNPNRHALVNSSSGSLGTGSATVMLTDMGIRPALWIRR